MSQQLCDYWGEGVGIKGKKAFRGTWLARFVKHGTPDCRDYLKLKNRLGLLSQLSIQLVISAQVMISEM